MANEKRRRYGGKTGTRRRNGLKERYRGSRGQEEDTHKEGERKQIKWKCITGKTAGKKEELGKEWETETVERRAK